jgi:Gluconate 2-dehydrogenase subunit 3
MKRRHALQSIAGISFAGAVAQPAPVPQQAPASASETPKLETETADAAAQSVHRFFSPDQYSALERLSEALVPGIADTPGAIKAGVPEFLDFLISRSPAERQNLYRDGLDHLNADATQRYGRAFADMSIMEAASLLAPLTEPWTYQGPQQLFPRFLRAAKVDVLYATMNSREWAIARAKRSRRAGAAGTYWYPID